jgi:hypothetical protein
MEVTFPFFGYSGPIDDVRRRVMLEAPGTRYYPDNRDFQAFRAAMGSAATGLGDVAYGPWHELWTSVAAPGKYYFGILPGQVGTLQELATYMANSFRSLSFNNGMEGYAALRSIALASSGGTWRVSWLWKDDSPATGHFAWLTYYLALNVLTQMAAAGFAHYGSVPTLQYGYLQSADGAHASAGILTGQEAFSVFQDAQGAGLVPTVERNFPEDGIPVFMGRVAVSHSFAVWTNNLDVPDSYISPETAKIVQLADGTLVGYLDGKNTMRTIGQSVVAYQIAAMP